MGAYHSLCQASTGSSLAQWPSSTAVRPHTPSSSRAHKADNLIEFPLHRLLVYGMQHTSKDIADAVVSKPAPKSELTRQTISCLESSSLVWCSRRY